VWSRRVYYKARSLPLRHDSLDTKINRPNLFEPKSQRKRFVVKQFGRLISV
jgi:hypothetical protein